MYEVQRVAHISRASRTTIINNCIPEYEGYIQRYIKI